MNEDDWLIYWFRRLGSMKTIFLNWSRVHYLNIESLNSLHVRLVKQNWHNFSKIPWPFIDSLPHHSPHIHTLYHSFFHFYHIWNSNCCCSWWNTAIFITVFNERSQPNKILSLCWLVSTYVQCMVFLFVGQDSISHPPKDHKSTIHWNPKASFEICPLVLQFLKRIAHIQLTVD